MLRGLDLFSGYGGITRALGDYVKPILYCEKEAYAQAILLTRMDEGDLPFAPIWNDVTTLDGKKLKGMVEIIYGGFPCQDISVAGKFDPRQNDHFLESERSGLFKEIIRLAREIKPSFIFLENVPAIESRGAERVQEALAENGYASRWDHLSAAEVGANHRRERWFCLAFNAANANRLIVRSKSGRSCGPKWEGENESGNYGQKGYVADSNCVRESSEQNAERSSSCGPSYGREYGDEEVSHSDMQGFSGQATSTTEEDTEGFRESDGRAMPTAFDSHWWETEPDVGRVVNGPSFRMDSFKSEDGQLVHKSTNEKAKIEELDGCFRKNRITALGNGVVPLQVRTIFERLLGVDRG